MMLMTGDIEIHKTDGIVRHCEGVLKMDDGSLAVFDIFPSSEWELQGGNVRNEVTGDIVEPDLIVTSDKYNMIEREDTYWDNTSAEALMKRARKRDDVDVEDVRKNV